MIEYREMTMEDYEASFALWERTEGMALSEADSKESISGYLNRNMGMSFVCTADDRVVGTVLGGHDGRRGFLYHAAVSPEYRGQSIAAELVSLSLAQLKSAGITKCHIMVIEDNEIGKHFWKKSGWVRRDGILLYSTAI